jgi:N-acetylglucosaminyldiphosphoundecaprenol N-acetyl-beta-D-mannosaminyltransferase
MPGAERINLLGVGLSGLNMNLALDEVFYALDHRVKGYVCVTGVHGIMEAQNDERFRKVLNSALLVTPDGMPLVWWGKWNGLHYMDRVYGPDLMLEVLRCSVARGYKHFLYGGTRNVTGELAIRLKERFPGLQVVGTFEPPFRPLTEQEAADLQLQVQKAKPDVFWVGLSTPKQEKFMAEYLPRLETTLMFGVGAAFDFHSGRVRQAPRWIQRSGFEWLFRLSQEPRRLWKRYLINNPRFLLRAAGQMCGWKKYTLD